MAKGSGRGSCSYVLKRALCADDPNEDDDDDNDDSDSDDDGGASPAPVAAPVPPDCGAVRVASVTAISAEMELAVRALCTPESGSTDRVIRATISSTLTRGRDGDDDEDDEETMEGRTVEVVDVFAEVADDDPRGPPLGSLVEDGTGADALMYSATPAASRRRVRGVEVEGADDDDDDVEAAIAPTTLPLPLGFIEAVTDI